MWRPSQVKMLIRCSPYSLSPCVHQSRVLQHGHDVARSLGGRPSSPPQTFGGRRWLAAPATAAAPAFEIKRTTAAPSVPPPYARPQPGAPVAKPPVAKPPVAKPVAGAPGGLPPRPAPRFPLRPPPGGFAKRAPSKPKPPLKWDECVDMSVKQLSYRAVRKPWCITVKVDRKTELLPQKQNKKMNYIQMALSDGTGRVNMYSLFPNAYAMNRDLLLGKVYKICGRPGDLWKHNHAKFKFTYKHDTRLNLTKDCLIKSVPPVPLAVASLDEAESPHWRITAKLVWLSPLCHVPGCDVQYINCIFADGSGLIDAVAFDTRAAELAKKLSLNKVYDVSGGISDLHKSKGKHSSLPNRRFLMLDYTLVRVAPVASLETAPLSYNFTSLRRLHESFGEFKKRAVDVLGVVTRAEAELRELRPGVLYRVVRLSDGCNEIVAFLHGKHGADFPSNLPNGQVIFSIRNAYHGEPGIVSLSDHRVGSEVILNPDIPEAADLKRRFLGI